MKNLEFSPSGQRGPQLPAFSNSDFFQNCCFVNGMFRNWMFQLGFLKLDFSNLDFSKLFCFKIGFFNFGFFKNLIFKIGFLQKFDFPIELSAARVPRPASCAAGISPQQKMIQSLSAVPIEFDMRRYAWTLCFDMRRYAQIRIVNCWGKGVGGLLTRGGGGAHVP